MCVCEVMNLALIKKIGIIFVFCFNSGLPIALTASILKALLHDYSIDLTTLGVFGLVTAPYSLDLFRNSLIYLQIMYSSNQIKSKMESFSSISISI